MDLNYKDHIFITYDDFSEKELDKMADDSDYYICTKCKCVVYDRMYCDSIIEFSSLNEKTLPNDYNDFHKYTCEELIVKKILE